MLAVDRGETALRSTEGASRFEIETMNLSGKRTLSQTPSGKSPRHVKWMTPTGQAFAKLSGQEQKTAETLAVFYYSF